ncbi:Bug family tripartite tricarboxylate transporter substrate binding protein [Billgrantia endophytica]|nr:tripartite tricarboxylate transporter substrate binding protein [Halomonas endophytica]
MKFSYSSTIRPLLRRTIMAVLLGLSVTIGSILPASAQRADIVTLVVPFGAGGGVDTVMRAVAERLSDELGRRVLVENRPGGSTMIAVDYVSRAATDGSIFLIGTPSLSSNFAFQPEIGPGDPRELLDPVIPVATQPYGVILGPALPDEISSIEALLEWAEANPGRLDMVNSGPLTAPRLAAELLSFRTGIPITAISYPSGTEGALDVAGGRVHAGINQIVEAMPQVQAGNLRMIAVTSLERSPVFPDMPTVSETIEDFDVTSWNGMFAPAGTPDAVLDEMNAAMNAVLQDESLHAMFRDQGTEFIGGTREDLANRLNSEIEGWQELDANVDLDLQ